jgi:replicative DNA helicase
LTQTSTPDLSNAKTIHDQDMLAQINEFEQRAWDPNTVGIKCGLKGIDDAIYGFQTGLHMIGGESNVGKSTLLMNIIVNMVTDNEDVVVIDFSLDDSSYERQARFIACRKKITINAAKRPWQHLDTPGTVERQKAGVEEIRQLVERYHLYDSSKTTTLEEIDEIIKQHAEVLHDDFLETRRLVVTIDSFHDLTTEAKEASDSNLRKYEYIVQKLSDMATKYDIPIICTAELRKINAGFSAARRPTKDDIREAGKIGFKSKSILLCYNEVSLRGESALIYFDRPDRTYKCPVFEVHVAKNKFGEFKGRMFYFLYPEMCYLQEVDSNSHQRYTSLIYSH